MTDFFTTEELNTLRVNVQAAVDSGRVFCKRTHGYNYDYEELTVDQVVDCFDYNQNCGRDELLEFAAKLNEPGAELEYDHNSSAWTCGDGCCSESDYFTLVVE